jgi:hypothetical protein
LIAYALLGTSRLLVVGPDNFYARVTDGERARQGQERVDVLSAERC